MNICARKGLSEMRTHAQILCLRYYSAERHSKNEKLKILFLGRDEFSCAVLKELENAQGMVHLEQDHSKSMFMVFSGQLKLY